VVEEIEQVVTMFAAVVQGPPSDERIGIYRSLVRRGIISAARAQLSRTAAKLGPLFDAYANRWLDAGLPSSPYLRDAASEFCAWAAPIWAEDEAVPAWIADLARYEAATFEVAAAVSGEGATGIALALDRAVRFDGATRLERYAWAVHRGGTWVEEGEAPEREATAVLLYRDAEHEVRCLALTPLAASIVERLLAGETLGGAVTAACAALGEALGEPVLRGTAELLADLAERGVVLGATG